jgi:hypothetical protein
MESNKKYQSDGNTLIFQTAGGETIGLSAVD